MRSLIRNRRAMYYAPLIGTEPIYDAYGNETLEERNVYGSPIPLKANVSANVGGEAAEIFGAQTAYSRSVCFAGKECPLSEGDKVWFGVDVTRPNNYIVVKVADSVNGFAVALREVTDRE